MANPSQGGGNGTQAQQISYYAAQFDKQFPGQNVGKAFRAFVATELAKDPSLSISQLASAWLGIIAVKGVGKAVADALGGAGQQIAKIPSAIGAGLAPITNPLSGITGFLTGLTQANLWLRITEVAIGVVLLAVGVARLTGQQNPISQLVKARIP